MPPWWRRGRRTRSRGAVHGVDPVGAERGPPVVRRDDVEVVAVELASTEGERVVLAAGAERHRVEVVGARDRAGRPVGVVDRDLEVGAVLGGCCSDAIPTLSSEKPETVTSPSSPVVSDHSRSPSSASYAAAPAPATATKSSATARVTVTVPDRAEVGAPLGVAVLDVDLAQLGCRRPGRVRPRRPRRRRPPSTSCACRRAGRRRRTSSSWLTKTWSPSNQVTSASIVQSSAAVLRSTAR